ncbi:MAG: ribulose-phosphate 3-epimerase [Candidatus Woesearchaeota archaeon]
MTRLSASLLTFYVDARRKNKKNDAMIAEINNALSSREKEHQVLHLDIMDGKFVHGKSFTPAHVRKFVCKHKREAHLMVVNYEKYVRDFFLLADMFIIHQEVLKANAEKTIDFLHKNKKFVGIAINPDTSISEIKFLHKIDLILVMAVYPGLPGQQFMESSLRRIKRLKEIRQQKKLKFAIEVDGGINERTGKKCIAAGADIIVSGSWFFSDEYKKIC